MIITTHVEAKLQEVRAFVLAACGDGWSLEPTYPGSESVDTACTLKREGYVMQVIARSPQQAHVSIWGPDRLAIRAPSTYDWEDLQDACRTCLECGARDVDTTRVGFAGRVCFTCLPEVQPRVEFPGWTN